MSALKFADSYNMFVFLAKPTESEGFEQIVDFLNANPIKYALTVNPTIYTSCIEQFWATTMVKTVNGEVQLQALVDGKWENSVERAATTASSLEEEQDSGNIIRTQSTTIPNSNDLPLSRVNTLGSGEGKLKLKELMDLCTKLFDKVLDLETTKTAQANEIASLKKRVKKLERKRKSKTLRKKRLFKIGRSARVISSDEDSLGQDVVEKEVSTADPVTTTGEVVTTASVEVSAARATLVSAATTTTTTAITEVDLTLAQALAELRSAKPKVVVQELVKSTTIITPSTIPKAKSITFRDPAKEEEQARLAREKVEKVEKANISWDNVQVIIKADRLLAERLQAREQEELTDEEKARLFVELLEKRKKHFAALKA
ncbi:hypothetical protein Tco_0579271 [Tanacetum coccineum]